MCPDSACLALDQDSVAKNFSTLPLTPPHAENRSQTPSIATCFALPPTFRNLEGLPGRDSTNWNFRRDHAWLGR